jgi:ribosomal protein L31E
MDEKVYIIPLREEARKSPRNKRAKRAINTIRRFLAKHTKIEKVSISGKINETIWASGRHGYPKDVKVRVKIIDGVAVTKAMDEMFIEKAKEEKKPVVDKAVSEPEVAEKADAKKEEHKHDGHKHVEAKAEHKHEAAEHKEKAAKHETAEKHSK